MTSEVGIINFSIAREDSVHNCEKKVRIAKKESELQVYILRFWLYFS